MPDSENRGIENRADASEIHIQSAVMAGNDKQKDFGIDGKDIVWEDGIRYQLLPSFIADETDMSLRGVAFDLKLGDKTKEGKKRVYIKMANPMACQEKAEIPKNNISYLIYNEGKILAGLDHPNVIKVHDFTVAKIDGKFVPCIAMEYLSGQCLGDYRKYCEMDHKELNEDLLDFLYDIAEGIDYVHSQGIVHCDIKPGNFFKDVKVSVDGGLAYKRGVLFDFATARRVENQDSYYDIFDGNPVTPGYATSEVLTSGKTRKQDDRWAFAASIFALITNGEVPYGRDKDEIDMPGPKTAIRVADPENLRKLVDMEDMVSMYGRQACSDLDFLFNTLLNNELCGDDDKFNTCRKIVAAVRGVLGMKPRKDVNYFLSGGKEEN